jgi:hypothetical protein
MDQLKRSQIDDVRQCEKREAKEQAAYPRMTPQSSPQIAYLPGQRHQQKHQDADAEITETLILAARAFVEGVEK